MDCAEPPSPTNVNASRQQLTTDVVEDTEQRLGDAGQPDDNLGRA